MKKRTTTYQLGSTTVELNQFRAADSPEPFLFALHDNETTARKAGRDVIKEWGGTLLVVSHSGDRNIMFSHRGSTYCFDPNRIFSDIGARRTLEAESPVSSSPPDEVVRRVRQFAEELVETYSMNERPQLVTLHNTTDTLTVSSYAEGNRLEEHAGRVHLESGAPSRDFFYVTEQELFEHFREVGFNVVLQNQSDPQEDGSLSVRAVRMGIPYINVETELGQRERQKKMIQEVYRLLS